MKKEIKEFIEEITDKYSELYIETFILKYTYDFKDKHVLENLIKSLDILNTKFKQIISKKFAKIN